MKPIARYLVLAMLLCLPAQAAGPLAFLAKDLVKGIIRSFVESGINQMLSTAGPCGLPLTPPGGALGGMLAGGGMPSLSTMARGGAMPSLPGAAGMARGALPGMGAGAMPPGMERMMKDQMAQAEAMAAKERGSDVAGPAGVQAPGAMPDMAAAMQMMQGGDPLSPAEIDELGTLLERMSTAMPSAASKCKPGEMKAVVAMASDSPMTSGVFRMMLGSMRDMQLKLNEARDTFAKMPEPERAEYVETTAAEFRGWDKDSKQAFVGMVESDFLGMPDTMKTQLLARLKQVR